jgi:beta-phosphoglucomutase family hydrolase
MENQERFCFEAVIFDLDGVITKTAVVHASAWKAMFDEYLKLREDRDGEHFQEFTYEKDYLTYVDGKPRYQGVKSFLESREIYLPFGDKEDLPDKETVCGLGNRKNIKFRECLRTEGVEVYDGAIVLVKDLKANGIHIGVASSSKNCQYVLESARIEQYFETRVDGVVSAELGLQGKPKGDIFVTAAKNVGVAPEKAIIVEDAVSGVQAGVDGKFGLVLGVARENNADELKSNGADRVVKDFEGVNTQVLADWFDAKQKS